jgi:hemolysin III
MHVATAPTPTKPLLRGVLHEVAAALALVAVVLLVRDAEAPLARAAAAAYGATLVALFSVSALYHRPTWTPQARLVMRRLDHAAIFLLIAGTYTPLCLLLGGTRGHALLAVVWAGAVAGIVQTVFWTAAPRKLVVGLYVLLGWTIVPLLPALHGVVGTAGLALLAAGGVAYTVGAAVYATRRPDPAPRVFGYHEVFHLLVVVAAACHLAVVAKAIRSLG